MEINVSRLTPGMIIEQDVLGKSGNPIIEKNTRLTETHIEFLQKFLVEKVIITPLKNDGNTSRRNTENHLEMKQKNQLFANEYERVVGKYKKEFLAWQYNVPFEMYRIRKMIIPLFDKAKDQSANTIFSLLPHSQTEDYFYYRSVVLGLLSVFLAKKIGYRKKDWLQIGFAALLSDSGKAKMEQIEPRNKNRRDPYWRKHPVYSYRLVESATTLTKRAKIAILQHHEYLDGSGFPIRVNNKKIEPYARLITVCDLALSVYSNDVEEIINVLDESKGKQIDLIAANSLIGELKEVMDDK